MKQRLTLLLALCMLVTNIHLTQAQTASEQPWYDTFYQYRLALTIQVDKPGWVTLPLSTKDITAAINNCEELQYDPVFFAYNQVEFTDKKGHVLDKAGFYMVPVSGDLKTEEITGKPQEIKIPTKANAFYWVTYTSQGGGKSPLGFYDQIDHMPENPFKKQRADHFYYSSYEPGMLQKDLMTHERLLISDGNPMKITVKGGPVIGAKSLTVQQVTIQPLVYFETPGKKELYLYYQPMCGHHVTIPKLRKDVLPNDSAKVITKCPAEKYYGNTQYRLSDNTFFSTWFADSTVKITPDMPVPQETKSGISISAAKNEAQTFQLMLKLKAKKELTFENISVSKLSNRDGSIAPENCEIYALEYVPILKKSLLTPASCNSPMADPLVKVQPKRMFDIYGNQPFCITVTVPDDAVAGDYNGTITLTFKEHDAVKIPLKLHVYDFALPEFSKLQSCFGLQFFMNPGRGGKYSPVEYHGLPETLETARKLSNKYFEVAAKNKFYPKTVALYTPVKFKWDAPPKGYNVDAPDNFFKLYDWDFTEFNKQLSYYIDELKVNSVCLTHTNPPLSSIFKHLPGNERKKLPTEDFRKAGIPMVTMEWQFTKNRHFVGYDLDKKIKWHDETTEITQKQFDRLLLDYYRPIVKNLEENGWLDKIYICVDELHDNKRLLHFLRLLKSDPVTAKIKIIQLIQGLSYFWYKDDNTSDEYAYNGLITYVPELDERYNRWEKYYFTDYNITPDREKLWNYVVYSSRLVIDTPGINNRMIGLDIFNRGGSGYYLWESLIWDTARSKSDNPWIDPYTPMGNGGLQYFYPPDKYGKSAEPDYTVIPSIRVLTYRESVEDYDYALMLENLIAKAKQQGLEATQAQQIMNDIERFFVSTVMWSQNDAYFIELRDRMANAIINLNEQLN